MNETIEVEPVPTKALARIEPQQGVGILRPADSLDAIAQAFKDYQRVCETILDNNSDYQSYEGKPRKKKSAWRKLATAFNVSTKIVSSDIVRPDGRHVVMATFTVEASTPGGRVMQATGSCEVNEKCCANSRALKCHKSAWKGHFCCPNGCDGRKHWSHPDHDIVSTAQTRATNRAIADLIGCGEVSAEELVDEPPVQNVPEPSGGVSGSTPSKKTAPSPKREPTKATMAGGEDLRVWLEKCKTKLFTLLQVNLGAAWQFAVKDGWILNTERLEDSQTSAIFPGIDWSKSVEDNKLVVQQRHAAIMAGVQAIADAEPDGEMQAKFAAAYVDDKGEIPAETEVPRDPDAGEAADDEWWRDVEVHFGQRKGEKLGEMEKNYLYGWWANWEPKPFKGKISESDKRFRQALDAAGEHYEFKAP